MSVGLSTHLPWGPMSGGWVTPPEVPCPGVSTHPLWGLMSREEVSTYGPAHTHHQVSDISRWHTHPLQEGTWYHPPERTWDHRYPLPCEQIDRHLWNIILPQLRWRVVGTLCIRQGLYTFRKNAQRFVIKDLSAFAKQSKQLIIGQFYYIKYIVCFGGSFQF